jgi:hypothetical protein
MRRGDDAATPSRAVSFRIYREPSGSIPPLRRGRRIGDAGDDGAAGAGGDGIFLLAMPASPRRRIGRPPENRMEVASQPSRRVEVKTFVLHLWV